MSFSEKGEIKYYRVAGFADETSVMYDVTIAIGCGKLLDIRSASHPEEIRLPDVILVPGLVNAHTHLEFSLLETPIPTTGRFTDWIRAVIRYRREHPDIASEAIQAGLTESLRNGTTLIGDIATTGWTDVDYSARNFSGVVFQELLGLGDARVAAQRELARTHAGLMTEPTSLETKASSVVRHGLSPHAPYSIHPDLLREAVIQSQMTQTPIAMHLAETEAELELLADGSGDFCEMLTELGIWRPDLFGRRRPLDFLNIISEAAYAMVVHGNYLNDEELRFLAERPHLTLVYCPRTHFAFGHQSHPWRRLIELGGSVAIGTDSRASNPDLSIFAELQFLAEHHRDMSHLDLLALATTNGRRALEGRETPTHRLDSFHLNHPIPATFTGIRVHTPSFRDVQRDLFARENKVFGTMIAGNWVSLTDDFSFC